jgi:Asp-tRNA(Asn)/Glu-tRNA(Gln) amidotransferase A subunit family amidase
MALRIRSGELTSEALVGACLDRIAAREAEVGAWTYLDAAAALSTARAADRSPARGALHGVPIGVKDIIDTSDMPTGLGFAPYAGRRPIWDAACVAMCREAGAIILGKTVTTEFAYFSPGKSRNPHNLAHTPGGSSSGSAAAVADGMVPAAFGSQTAGSLTRPAAYCGIVGYKASHGEFSLSGLRPLAESFDSLGILTRNVADAALMRAVLLRQDASTTRPLRTLRLGFCRSFDWHRMEDAAKDATDSALASLKATGARIEDIELPTAFAPMNELHHTIMAFEVARNYTFERVFHRANLSATFLALCETGMETDHSSYVEALNQIASCRTAFAQLFAGYDAWLAPSALGEAPLASDGTGDPVMSRMWTALQAPSVSLPVGRGPRLPIALQLVGPPRSDDQLLSAALWLEQHLAWT